MTELGVADPRVIAPDAPQYNATVVRRVDMHESLAYFWVKFDGEPTPFLPGQYMTIGVFADERIVQRPYSVASDPAVAGSTGYEFYVRLVQAGQFTPLLWRLPVGHGMRMIGPKGKFLLEPDDDRTHIFISTGTGDAPFVAMMQAMIREGRPRSAIFINGVSWSHSIRADPRLPGPPSRSWIGWRSGDYPVTYVPTVSRPKDPANAGWTKPGLAEYGSGACCGRSTSSDPDARELDRLHLRQSRHDPGRRRDAPRTRLSRGPDQEGALLAEGQGAAIARAGRRPGTARGAAAADDRLLTEDARRRPRRRLLGRLLIPAPPPGDPHDDQSHDDQRDRADPGLGGEQPERHECV